MSKYIDGDNLMMSLADWWYSSFGQEETKEAEAIRKVMNAVEESIKVMPTAPVIPYENLRRYADWFCAQVSYPEFVREAIQFYEDSSGAMEGGTYE